MDGITVDETLAVIASIIDSYYLAACDDDCENPVTPEDTPIVRIGASGAYEQLIDGSWQTPTGDLEPIPPEPREEASEVDRLCAAASNTALALRLTYDEVFDAYLTFGTAEAVVEAFLTITAAVVAPFVPPAAIALLALEAAVFNLLFELLGILTENQWDDDLNDDLTCLLLQVATEDVDHRITFDFNELNNLLVSDWVNSFEYPKYIVAMQLQYLLSFIGVDGLNYAGGLTETEGNCDTCDDTWCAYFDFTIDNGGWSVVPAGGGTHVASTGWRTTYFIYGSAGYRGLTITKALSAARTITKFVATYEITWGNLTGTPADARNITMRLNQAAVPNDPVRQFFPNTSTVLQFSGSLGSVTSLNFLATTGYDSIAPLADQGGQITLKSIRVHGLGSYPFTGYECD